MRFLFTDVNESQNKTYNDLMWFSNTRFLWLTHNMFLLRYALRLQPYNFYAYCLDWFNRLSFENSAFIFLSLSIILNKNMKILKREALNLHKNKRRIGFLLEFTTIKETWLLTRLSFVIFLFNYSEKGKHGKQ